MKSDKLKKLILTALMIALVCVATMVIHIPTVAGYANLGDGLVLLSAFLLGPWYGLLAGGLGSALADFLSGYAYYVPGTFLIKGGMALITALLLHSLHSDGGRLSLRHTLFSAVPAELFMVVGYFLYKAFILGRFASALTSIPSNLMQGLVGVAVAAALTHALYAVPALREHFWKGSNGYV